MTPVGVFFICQNEDKCHFVNSTNFVPKFLLPKFCVNTCISLFMRL